jgi:hypothetical protein
MGKIHALAVIIVVGFAILAKADSEKPHTQPPGWWNHLDSSSKVHSNKLHAKHGEADKDKDDDHSPVSLSQSFSAASDQDQFTPTQKPATSSSPMTTTPSPTQELGTSGPIGTTTLNGASGDNAGNDDQHLSTVPESGTLGLLGLGLVMVAILVRKAGAVAR